MFLSSGAKVILNVRLHTTACISDVLSFTTFRNAELILPSAGHILLFICL